MFLNQAELLASSDKMLAEGEDRLPVSFEFLLIGLQGQEFIGVTEDRGGKDVLGHLWRAVSPSASFSVI